MLKFVNQWSSPAFGQTNSIGMSKAALSRLANCLGRIMDPEMFDLFGLIQPANRLEISQSYTAGLCMANAK